MATSNILCLIFLTTLVSVVYGASLEELRVKRQAPTPEECLRPPMKRLAHECCKLPRERIWGDLRSSLNKCTPRRRQEQRPMLKMSEGDESTFPQNGPEETEPVDGSRPNKGRKRPFGVKPLSEKVNEMFTSVFKVIKNSIDVLWQSVVMLTDHFRRRVDDQCFMECVFEDQGFLFNQRINKDALLERLHRSLGRNERWLSVAVAAVEACHTPDTLELPPNSTCQSGSEEIFRCVFKHIFFNCPTWPQKNEYCTYLKDYYQKCPDGPPPETQTEEAQTTAMPEAMPEATPETTSEAGEPEEETEEVTSTEEPSDE